MVRAPEREVTMSMPDHPCPTPRVPHMPAQTPLPSREKSCPSPRPDPLPNGRVCRSSIWLLVCRLMRVKSFSDWSLDMARISGTAPRVLIHLPRSTAFHGRWGDWGNWEIVFCKTRVWSQEFLFALPEGDKMHSTQFQAYQIP